jgi:AraC family transcriptional regulator of adaptative response / DNA-3-methyladenine glycosylase II
MMKPVTPPCKHMTLALSANSISFSFGADQSDEMEKLRKLPGFGPWTVQYIAMRVFGWPDAFPHTDYGVKKALPERSPQEILTLSQAWSPWRSYATILLWNSLHNKLEMQKGRYGTR